MKKTLIFSALLLAMQVSHAAPLQDTKTITSAEMSTAVTTLTKNINWVSVSDIEKSLPKTKMVVGLDIDDTMLFSSPVFHKGQQKYSPGSFDYLKNQDFWDEASTGDDQYSIPKQSAVKLVTMHLKRGDTVYFITGRTAPSKAKETLTATIKNIFPKKYQAQIKDVVFADGLEKKDQLKASKVTLYYGDSDSDITSAQKVGARAIRFLRNAQSTYQPLPQAGKYGEEVLINSNY